MTTSPQRCATKVRYMSADAALAARREAVKSMVGTSNLHAYRCNVCRRFHLGNAR